MDFATWGDVPFGLSTYAGMNRSVYNSLSELEFWMHTSLFNYFWLTKRSILSVWKIISYWMKNLTWYSYQSKRLTTLVYLKSLSLYLLKWSLLREENELLQLHKDSLSPNIWSARNWLKIWLIENTPEYAQNIIFKY